MPSLGNRQCPRNGGHDRREMYDMCLTVWTFISWSQWRNGGAARDTAAVLPCISQQCTGGGGSLRAGMHER